jgi:hypothetical protein
MELELERHGSIFFAFVDVEIPTLEVRAVYDLESGADVTDMEKDAPDVLQAVRGRV